MKKLNRTYKRLSLLSLLSLNLSASKNGCVGFKRQ